MRQAPPPPKNLSTSTPACMRRGRCLYVCVSVCMYAYRCSFLVFTPVCVCVSMHICVYVSMYKYMCECATRCFRACMRHEARAMPKPPGFKIGTTHGSTIAKGIQPPWSPRGYNHQGSATMHWGRLWRHACSSAWRRSECRAAENHVLVGFEGWSQMARGETRIVCWWL